MSNASQRNAQFKGLALAFIAGSAVAALLFRNFGTTEQAAAIEPNARADSVIEERVAVPLEAPRVVADAAERNDAVEAAAPIEEPRIPEGTPKGEMKFGDSLLTAKEYFDSLQRKYAQFQKESDPDSFEYRGNDPEYGLFLSMASIESIMVVQGRAQFEPDPGLEGHQLIAKPGFRCFGASGAKYHFPDGEFPIYDTIVNRMHMARLEKQDVPPLTEEQVAEVERLYQAAHQALSVYQ